MGGHRAGAHRRHPPSPQPLAPEAGAARRGHRRRRHAPGAAAVGLGPRSAPVQRRRHHRVPRDRRLGVSRAWSPSGSCGRCAGGSPTRRSRCTSRSATRRSRPPSSARSRRATPKRPAIQTHSPRWSSGWSSRRSSSAARSTTAWPSSARACGSIWRRWSASRPPRPCSSRSVPRSCATACRRC